MLTGTIVVELLVSTKYYTLENAYGTPKNIDGYFVSSHLNLS